MIEKIKQTAEFLQAQVKGEMPKLAIILGSGLGNLVDHIEDKQVIAYKDIPNFPVSTVEGHSGNLIFGTLSGRRVMAMQGRFHYYEGYDMKAVTFPVRVMKALGVETITDHINLFPENPLRGKNYNELGTRFPAMTEAYNHELVKKADKIAEEKGLRLMHGVYVGTTGPTFETPAEYEYFRIIGGDAVGMSTVPEVIVANHAGMKVFGVSVITDLGGKDIRQVPTHEEVQLAAENAQPTMLALIKELAARV